MKNRRSKSAGRRPKGTWRTDVILLAGILLLGLVLRVAYLRENMQNPDFTSPAVDAGFHDYWARGLAFGEWTPPEGEGDPRVRETTFFRPPGYPYFLSFVYRLAGPGYLAPRIVQIALGLLNCALMFVIARRWFGRPTAAVAAALMAIYWGLIYFEQELHAPVLVIALLLAGVYALGRWAERPALLPAICAGLALGLASLAIPSNLILVPLVALWMLYVIRRRGDRRRILIALAGLGLGTVLAVAPATIRNCAVARDFVLISSNGGINLYLGNNPQATGFCDQEIPGFGQFGTCYDYPQIVANVERHVGEVLKDSEVSAFFVKQALAFAREQPATVARLIGKKALLFVGPREIAHNKIIECERGNSAVLRYSAANFPLVLSLALLGVLGHFVGRWGRDQRERIDVPDVQHEISLLSLGMIAASFLVILPFFVTARYRIPTVPFLILFAADGVCNVVRLAASKKYGAVAWAGGSWVLLFLLASHQFVPYDTDRADWHFKRGTAFGRAGQIPQAIDEYRRALQIRADFDRASYNLARQYEKQRSFAQAVEQYRHTLNLDPDHIEANNNLAVLLAVQGELDEAIARYRRVLELDPEHYEAHFNLACTLAAANRLEDALRQFKVAVSLRPDGAAAHYQFGRVLLRQGELEESAAAFLEAIRLDPRYADAYHYLGVARGLQSRLPEAIEALRTELQLAPSRAATHSALGDLLAAQGKFEEAARAYQAALRIDPALRQAREGLRALPQGRSGTTPP